MYSLSGSLKLMLRESVRCRYLVNLVGELSRLLVVNRVRVKKGAKGFKVGLLLQQRGEVIRVQGEPGGNYFPDLPFDIIRLNNMKTDRTENFLISNFC